MRRKINCFLSVFVLTLLASGCATMQISSDERVGGNWMLQTDKSLLSGENITRFKDFKRKYDSYSFFLIPSPATNRNIEAEDVVEISRSFKRLANETNDRHMSIWFTDKNGNPDYQRMRTVALMLGKNIDGGGVFAFVEPNESFEINHLLETSSGSKKIYTNKGDVGRLTHKENMASIRSISIVELSDFPFRQLPLFLNDLATMINTDSAEVARKIRLTAAESKCRCVSRSINCRLFDVINWLSGNIKSMDVGVEGKKASLKASITFNGLNEIRKTCVTSKTSLI